MKTTNPKDVTRTISCGRFTITITPKTCPEFGHLTKWRKGMTVHGSVTFTNPEDAVRKRVFEVHQCQSKSVRGLLRTIMPMAWSKMYQYSIMLGAVDFQRSYLKHRIKIHARWVDYHTKLFADTGEAKHRKYVIDNATTEKKLVKRLEFLDNCK